MTRFPLRLLAAAALVTATATAAPAIAHFPAERIIAVVGETPILFSDMLERAKPFLLQVKARVPGGAEQVAAESQVYREVVARMIDDQLIAEAADRMKITVTPEEIERALATVAAANSLSVPALFTAAEAQGLSEAAYRADLRRQILEQKLLMLYAQKHVEITPADLRARYDRALQEERRTLPYRASAITLTGKKSALADEILKRARRGDDFAALVRQYSDDKKPTPPTPKGLITPGTWSLSPLAEDALFKLEPGQISEAVKLSGKVMILKLEERAPSRFHGFEGAALEMHNLLVTERLQTVRDQWIKGLRAAAYIEVAL